MRRIILLAILGSLALLSALNMQPILMSNNEMHDSGINRMAINEDRGIMLTCSSDKTARIWDIHSGALLKVLRPPVGYGRFGVLYGCALSPDGAWAAVGGFTEDKCLYVFDTNSGGMVRRLGPLDEVVTRLEFSPDGKFLVVGMVDEFGVKVFRCEDWQQVKSLEGYSMAVHDIAFSTDGKLLTASYDGKVRLYDSEFQLLRERDFGTEVPPVCAKFSPDGSRIAVSFFQSQRIAVLNSTALETLFEPDVTVPDLESNFLSQVCFSADGTQLIAGGTLHMIDESGWKAMLRVWQDGGRGSYQDFATSCILISCVQGLADGSIVFADSYPAWGKLDSQKKQSIVKDAGILNLASIDNTHLRLTSNGEEVGFTPYLSQPLLFDLQGRTLLLQQSTAPCFTDSLDSIKIGNWMFSTAPSINDKVITFANEYSHTQCVDIVPGANKALLATETDIFCYDSNASLLWKKSVPAPPCSIKSSGNSAVAVVALADGTLRWYRLSDGKLLLTLFVHSDTKRWILYTPEGYYDSAPGSESLIGWHINQAEDKEALFYTADRLRGTYYRPDIIDNIVKSFATIEALQMSEQFFPSEKSEPGMEESLPPVVTIISPSHNYSYTSRTVTLEYKINGLEPERVTSLRVLLDGRPYKSVKDPVLSGTTGTIEVELPGRDVRVGLIAENRFGRSELADVKLRWQGAAGNQKDTQKPSLYVLVIGINAYAVQELQLQYSAKDASDFANTIKLQDGLMYDTVSLRLLTDGQASRDNILDGLDWLQKACKPEDVAMIFLSGHGANDNIGLFYYLPVGADVTKLKSTCVPFSDFQNTLSAIPGKVILFADACHSGGIYTDSQVRLPDLNRFINELTSPEVGVVIFTSSTPRQSSLESEEWQNGAFTKALIEGLLGQADFMNKGLISVKELDLYISGRVRELTANRQTPTTIVPQSIPDFDIVQVIK